MTTSLSPRLLFGLTLLASLAPLSAQTNTPTQTVVPALSADVAPALSPDVVARFGNTEIKADELRTYLNSLDPKQREAMAHDPESLKKAVSAQIVQRMVLQEALEKKFEKQPAVAAQLKHVLETALVQGYLDSICKPPADYPTAAEVKTVYEANKSTFMLPRQYQLAQIFVACPLGADATTTSLASAKLETVKKSLAGPDPSFSAVAKAVSDDKQSGAKGGELGWITDTQIQPEIRNQVTALTKGAFSEPIRLKDGWHFLKLLDVAEPQPATLEQVRQQIIAQMRTMKTQANTQAYVGQMLKATPVSLNAPALSGLLK